VAFAADDPVPVVHPLRRAEGDKKRNGRLFVMYPLAGGVVEREHLGGREVPLAPADEESVKRPFVRKEQRVVVGSRPDQRGLRPDLRLAPVQRVGRGAAADEFVMVAGLPGAVVRPPHVEQIAVPGDGGLVQVVVAALLGAFDGDVGHHVEFAHLLRRWKRNRRVPDGEEGGVGGKFGRGGTGVFLSHFSHVGTSCFPLVHSCPERGTRPRSGIILNSFRLKT